MNTYVVTFKHSESIFCKNLVVAHDIMDVSKKYDNYQWVRIKKTNKDEALLYKSKGMPVIVC